MPKKKVEKVMTVEVPKVTLPKEDAEIVKALDSLQASRGWAIVTKILIDNIAYLEAAILSKIDPLTRGLLTDDEVEILRTKRRLNMELRDTPKNYATIIKDTGEIPDDYDPYYKTNDEILKDKRRPPQDDKGSR